MMMGYDDVLDDIPLAYSTEGLDPEARLPRFLFKIKEENKLSQKWLQQIAKVTRLLLEGSIEGIKRKAVTSLSDAGINSTDVPGFDDAFVDGILDCNNIQAMASNVENYHKMEHFNIPFVVRILLLWFPFVNYTNTATSHGEIQHFLLLFEGNILCASQAYNCALPSILVFFSEGHYGLIVGDFCN